jgi:prepilin signal peptidase PulO-like enzyme (type II secretory pathway)
MFYLFVALLFVLGLIIGSFINAFEYRIDKDVSIAKGRSICPRCKKQIAWYDNIPVISFLLLSGKCRQCHKKISLQYPVIELLTGFAFALVASELKASFLVNGVAVLSVIALLSILFAAACLILVAVHDAKTSYIMSSVVYAGIAAMFIYYVATYTGARNLVAFWDQYTVLVIATAIPAIIFAALHFFSKGKWMGAGDIELAVLVGLFAGWPGIMPAYYFAFIVGAIWGLIQVYYAKRAGLKSEMPLGPFLVFGAFFGFVFGEQLVGLYARIFLGA